MNSNTNTETDGLNNPEDEDVAQLRHKAEEEDMHGTEKDKTAEVDHDCHMSARHQVGNSYCQLEWQRSHRQPKT